MTGDTVVGGTLYATGPKTFMVNGVAKTSHKGNTNPITLAAGSSSSYASVSITVLTPMMLHSRWSTYIFPDGNALITIKTLIDGDEASSVFGLIHTQAAPNARTQLTSESHKWIEPGTHTITFPINNGVGGVSGRLGDGQYLIWATG